MLRNLYKAAILIPEKVQRNIKGKIQGEELILGFESRSDRKILSPIIELFELLETRTLFWVFVAAFVYWLLEKSTYFEKRLFHAYF